ncbi:alpha/beta hydrolase-fold protein [Streptomyces sp. Je 1-369]|uniref:alpha/beta hydrolase-fold protein n=1 Tax=Streptomyces sp. Je 1-369 TaxID=2966192 RepID=UPI00228547D1|nr:alpha/beta hydrolase-fold protein [Streptomyces sp. Je 1-369]WAL96811.1 esterase family protein [Streptomyces sp. Je 1-369]
MTVEHGQRVTITHESKCLLANPLGDPHLRTVEVLLPPGYRSDERLPVVYWLPGYGATASLTSRSIVFGGSVAERVRTGMAQGTIPRALVVVPDCTTAYGGSQYINSPACGDYSDYLAEVVAEVDQRFRTRPGPAWRAIGGKSSGGYGALVAGMRSDLFGAVLAHSPDAGFEHSYLGLLPGALDTMRDAGGVTAFLGRRGTGPHDGQFMVAMSLLAMGMCYADEVPSDPADALPCDPETGVFRPAVWQTWLRHDPVRMVPGHLGRLRDLRLLHLDTGQRDEYHMHWGARALHATLAAHGISHTYGEHDGGHQGIEHRFIESLSLLKQLWRGDREGAR